MFDTNRIPGAWVAFCRAVGVSPDSAAAIMTFHTDTVGDEDTFCATAVLPSGGDAPPGERHFLAALTRALREVNTGALDATALTSAVSALSDTQHYLTCGTPLAQGEDCHKPACEDARNHAARRMDAGRGSPFPLPLGAPPRRVS